jgi:glycosyltransferase involved in cell wall biosynthesis
MIVKNESKIIKRLLDSVVNIIDCYCICDTGSTDNTIETITNYFNNKNITGKIVNEEFKNFCYNRNFALDACIGMSDYVLLLDADMILEIGSFNKKTLNNYDDYFILQGNEYFQYNNMRLIRNNGLYKYFGVTHEFLSSLVNTRTIYLSQDILFVNDIGDGGNKENKYLRDIELLKNGLIDEPENTRYYFYLGNSHFDLNLNLEAIEYYKKIVNMKEGWIQEKYMSCIKIYESYKKLNKEEDGIHYLILSTKFDENRVEGIFRLVKYYCSNELSKIAYKFYSLIQDYFENTFYNKNLNTYDSNISKYLFCLQIEYKYFLPYYMIIVSQRLKKYEIGIRMYEIIFACNFINAGEWYSNNLIYNLQFFIDKIDKINNIIFYKNCEKYINLLKNKYNMKYENLLKKYEEYYNDNNLNKKIILKSSNEFINLNNIFIYWTGKEYSLIKLLRKLIYAHSENEKYYKVHLITTNNILEYIKELPECFNLLRPAHQADFIRVNVICDYGGIWLDSDTLVIDNLTSLFDILKEKDGFFIKQNNEIIWNGIFGSIANTKLMKDWKKYINNILNTKKNNIKWEELGNIYLHYNYLHSSNPNLFENYKIFNGLDNIYPVNYDKCLLEYIQKPYDNYKNIIKEYQPLITLVNSVYKSLENLSEDQIMYQKFPLNYFINKSIDNLIKKYIVVADWLVNHVTLEQYSFCQNLEKLGWELILLSKLDINKLKNQKCIVLCVTYDKFDIKSIKFPNVTLIYRFDDLHPFIDIRDHCINNCDLLISPYKYLFPKWVNKYKNLLNKQCFYNPFSAVKEHYINIEFNNNPINKVFVSGYLNNTYPFRNYMINLSKENNNIETLDHPTYKIDNRTHDCIHEVYYKKLNNYICCFTDALCWEYVILKVYEITAVGSLLLIENTIEKQLNELGFYNEINCIMCNQSNVIEKMNWVLDNNNLEKVNDIRRNGMKLTREKHNTEIRAINFNNYVNNIKHKFL